MSFAILDDHSLIDVPCNWADGVKITLAWQTSLDTAVRGNEQRAALRPSPRLTMEWNLLVGCPSERSELEDSLRAALNRSRATVPYWPRPGYVASCVDNEIWLEVGNNPGYIVGERVWAFGLGSGVVTGYDAAARKVTLQSAMAITPGIQLFRLLRGRLTVESCRSLTNDAARMALKLRED